MTVYYSIVYQQDCRQLDCSIIYFQVNNGTSAKCKILYISTKDWLLCTEGNSRRTGVKNREREANCPTSSLKQMILGLLATAHYNFFSPGWITYST